MMKLRPAGLAPVLLLIGLALAGCSKPGEKVARYMERGNELFASGQFEKARIEYRNALRLKPTDPEIAYRLGTVEEAEGNYRGAFLDYTHAEEQNARFQPALLKLAEFYLAGGQPDQAQKRLDQVLADAPNDPDAHAIEAGLLLRRKDFAGTEKEARVALDKNPADVIAFSVLAGLYTTQGDGAKALLTVEDGIARNPKELPLLALRAEIYEKAGDFNGIAKSYDAIFQQAPTNIQYRLKLADIYVKAGRIDDAEAALRAGIAAVPDDWDMKRRLVVFLGDHRSLDAAEKEIRALIQVNPDREDLDAWLVDLYMGHNARDRAIAFLDQIIAENRFDRRGLYARAARARLDYAAGDRDDAAKLVKDVLANDPNNLDALFVKASLEADQGQYQSAVSDLRTILRDRPAAEEALRLLAEVLVQQGHLDLAVDTLSQVVDMNPADQAARVRLAQFYAMNGDGKRAMDLLFLMTKEDPTYAPGWESAARVALELKDWPTAEAAIHTLDGLEGQQKLATFLRGQLLEKTGKTKDAIAQYTEVVDADPTAPLAEHALASLVEAYQSSGQLADAARYIESLKSADPSVNTILGECYVGLGKTGPAAAAFDAAIAGHSVRPEPYLDRARLFLNEHKPEEALAVLKEGRAAAPANLRIPLTEAEILNMAGRYPETVAIYDELLARNPELDAVANNLAATIADHEYDDPASLEKARQVAERFVAATNPAYLDTLGWVYYRQGDIQEAEIVMERMFAAKAKLPPQIHYHYGAILLKANRVMEARAELQQAVAGTSDYPGLDDARKLLAGL